MSRSGLVVFVCTVALAAGATSRSQAQATLNHFRPAELAHDGFAVSGAEDQGHARFGVQLYGDWSHNAKAGGVVILNDQVALHLVLSLGLWDRLVIVAGVPFNVLQKDEPPGDGAGLGDVYATVRVRLAGEADDPAQLAVQGSVSFPTAEAANGGQALSGDDGFTGHPELVLQFNGGPVRFAINAGVLLRKDSGARDALTLGGGFRFDAVKDKLQILLEGVSSSDINELFKKNFTAIELLGGIKYHHAQGISVGVGGGPGFLDGVGSPDFRVFGTLAYTMPDEPPAPVDTDGDGIFDNQDGCPSEPEDQDGFEDDDGCVDDDNDGDGVFDADDKCPNDAEDLDGHEDTDGCPDTDNDGDGVADTNDECPDKAGPTENKGCPWPDQDGDGVPDNVDNCPTEAGPAKNQGCRKRRKVVIKETHLEILDKVYFRTGSSKLLRRSNALLNDVAAVLKAHPEIGTVQVEGHTDARGRHSTNMRLSQQRAESVVDYLVKRGVPATRLVAKGFGPDRPLVPNARTQTEHARNRRVEFNVVQAQPTEQVVEEE